MGVEEGKREKKGGLLIATTDLPRLTLMECWVPSHTFLGRRLGRQRAHLLWKLH